MNQKRKIQFKPDVDICIPCYNDAAHIGLTIRSVLAQTYVHFILHIIDNASTDNTLATVRSFRDPRIRIHKNASNIGMFGNMNRCIEVSTHTYLKILCSDDVLYPDCLMTQVLSLKKHADSVLSYATSSVINEADKVLLYRRFFRRDTEINGGIVINRILKSGRSLGEPSGLLFRTAVLKSHHIRFDTGFRSIGDLDLLIKILRHGNGYYNAGVLYAFRLTANQGTHTLARVAIEEHLKLATTYREEFLLTGIDLFLLAVKLRIIFVTKKLLLFVFARR
jgi:glycosyltransferase involved in cell wall biosynthesis